MRGGGTAVQVQCKMLSGTRKKNWSEEVVVVTGGTGSLGRKFVEIMLEEHRPKKLIVFSRDESKQHDMRAEGLKNPGLQYVLGDVRDAHSLERAFSGVTTVVHAAAMKQVAACESNPFQAIQTNIIGSKNVIDAAINRGVRRVIALSTDKAVHPINLYGATKLCAEKMLIQANAQLETQVTRFSGVRPGNFLGSRSSVIPLFVEQRKRGRVTITDARMTRFWITLDRAAHFVIECLERMQGGEIFVPKMPSMKLLDMAQAVAPSCHIESLGTRPGEKLHEELLSEDEARYSRESDEMFVIRPTHGGRATDNWNDEVPVPEGFRYASNTNSEWLTPQDLCRLLEDSAQPLPWSQVDTERRVQ
jgi:UDP-N-acetylglucosamine 4,6-dehydratase/5-epimerase